MGDLDFIEDRESVEPSGSYEPFEGTFKACVTSRELVPNSAGTGKILKTIHTISEGEKHAGRVIFTNFNVLNQSEKAQQIGRGQLSALAQACKLPPGIPDDSSKLLDIEHLITVVVSPASGRNPKTGEPYAAKSEIKSFAPLGKSMTYNPKSEKLVENKKAGSPKLKEKDLDDDNIFA